jgi:hypothetical protein
VWQKANEIKGFLKKFSARLLLKLVAKTNKKASISATRKTNGCVQITVMIIDR